ncbi:MAG: hypothetical protein PHG06_15245 [Parabacteroides sp.]|nr:hypothetical protein [Parabacteroides sp.]
MREENKQSRYKYSQKEKETLKVLKMQENDIDSLAKETTNQTQELELLRKRAEALAGKIGVTPIPKTPQKNVPSKSLQISKDEIPSWESLVERANSEISEDVILEDLLSKEEFNYCIEDVQRINQEFSTKTSIWNKTDLSFLAIATALQTARWLIIQKLCGDLGQTIDSETRLNHNDKKIKDSVNKSNKSFQNTFNTHGHRESNKSYKSWEQIIFSSAPYDTSVGSRDFSENLEGRYHRYKTLGHDPILGWLFGTANFITDTCTLSNFNSYRIDRCGTPHFSEQTNLGVIFYETFDSIKEDWLRLPAGIFAQYVHLKSDVFTKLGLPVPLIEVFSEQLAGNLYRNQYDSLCMLKDIAIVGNQAAWSILINMVISLIHGLFYNESKDGPDKDIYEVRTRKILLISNTLASSGNILYCAISEDWKKLDAGGILVSLYRLFSDVRFMTKVKEEFIQKELDKVIAREIAAIDSEFK